MGGLVLISHRSADVWHAHLLVEHVARRAVRQSLSLLLASCEPPSPGRRADARPILKALTARAPEFVTADGQEQALHCLARKGLEASLSSAAMARRQALMRCSDMASPLS